MLVKDDLFHIGMYYECQILLIYIVSGSDKWVVEVFHAPGTVIWLHYKPPVNDKMGNLEQLSIYTQYLIDGTSIDSTLGFMPEIVFIG